MNILILGKDCTLFDSGKNVVQDTRKRHIAYAEALANRYPGSEIRIITYTPRYKSVHSEKVNDALYLFGTRSWHRITYLLDVMLCLRTVMANGWRPDVVTVQTPWEEGLIGFIVACFIKAKYIPQLHFDLLSHEWKKEHWLNPLFKVIAIWMFKRADAVRVVSTVQRDKLIKELSLPSNKIYVAPVPVNFSPVIGDKITYKKKLFPAFDNKKIVLFVGRFYAQKNLPLWLDVAEEVAKEMRDVMFVLAGDGPLLSEITKLVEQKGLTNRFKFLGNMGHEKLPELYAAADVFLLTSHYEGFGRVILESYLAGVPVVSTTCTGPEDLISNNIDGFLVPCGDRKALIEAVIKLLRDDELKNKFGHAGKVKVETRFSESALTEQIIDIWARV